MRRFLSNILGDEEQKLFVKLTSQTFILRFIGMGLLYGNQVLMARLMGVSHYGDYTVIMTWINFMVAISIFGFDHGAQRFYSLLFARQDWGKARGFIRMSFRTISVVSVLCMAGWFLYLWNKQSSHNPYPRTYSEAFLWSMFVIPFLAIIYQASAVFRSLHRIKLSLVSVYILLPVGISAASFICYQLNSDTLRVDAAVLMNLLCTFLVALYLMRKVKKDLSPNYNNARPVYETGLWIRTTTTFFVLNLLALLIKQGDILFVSHYFGHGKAGIYSAAVKISALIPFGLSIVEYVYAPRISSLHAKNDKAHLQQYISHAAKIILLITVPLSVVLIGAGKYLLLLFGKEFQASYVPLVVLLIGQLINALTGMVGALMSMTGNQNIFLFVYVAASLVDIILNLLLVPALGATGAAIASSTSIIALNVCMYVLVWKKLGIKASIF